MNKYIYKTTLNISEHSKSLLKEAIKDYLAKDYRVGMLRQDEREEWDFMLDKASHKVSNLCIEDDGYVYVHVEFLDTDYGVYAEQNVELLTIYPLMYTIADGDTDKPLQIFFNRFDLILPG